MNRPTAVLLFTILQCHNVFSSQAEVQFRSSNGSRYVFIIISAERRPRLDIGPQASPQRPVLCVSHPSDSRDPRQVVGPPCGSPSNAASTGSSCLMKDGKAGVCKKLSQCDPAWTNMKNLSFPKFCSYNVIKPLVCCPDCQIVQESHFDFSFLINSYANASEECLEQFYRKIPCNKIPEFSNLDASIMCYKNPKMLETVIAGGYDAKRNEYPHMALIGYGDDPSSADWMCGGSVISDRYILSAAHCISSPALGEIKYAALGILKRTDHPDLWQTYDVVKIIGHPKYQPPSKYHDIALLATGAKIRFNREVLPACLHRGSDMPPVATATGWGAMGHRKQLAEMLQVVDINRFSDAECMAAYPVHRHLKNGYNKDTQVCYGDEEQINDTCEGDSGGPLQVKTEEGSSKKCLYTVIGVTSYGRACGYVGSSGMYTRVSHYVPWIESITGPLL